MKKDVRGLEVFHINNKNDICIICDKCAKIYDGDLNHITTFQMIDYPYSCCSNKSGDLLYILSGNQYIYIIETNQYEVIDKQKIVVVCNNTELGDTSYELSNFILSANEEYLIITAITFGKKLLLLHSICKKQTIVIAETKDSEFYKRTLFNLGGHTCLIDRERKVSFISSRKDNEKLYLYKKDIIQQPVLVSLLCTEALIRKYFGKGKQLQFVTFDNEFMVFGDSCTIYVYSRELKKTAKLKTKSFSLDYEYLSYKYYPEEKMLIIGTGSMDRRIFITRIEEEHLVFAEFTGFCNAAKVKDCLLLLSDYSISSELIKLNEISYNQVSQYCACIIHSEVPFLSF